MVVVIGLILIILTWLYPYYEGQYIEYRSPNVKKAYMGFYSLFNPPNKTEIYKEINGKMPEDSYEFSRYHSRIVISLLLVQLLIICLVCLGLFLLFSSTQIKKQKESSEAGNISFYKK
jgi:uncharacterized membrane protein